MIRIGWTRIIFNLTTPRKSNTAARSARDRVRGQTIALGLPLGFGVGCGPNLAAIVLAEPSSPTGVFRF